MQQAVNQKLKMYGNLLHMDTPDTSTKIGEMHSSLAGEIVSRFNCHDDLVEALKELEYCIMNINSIDGARHRASVINANKALAKAEGK